MAAKHKFYRSLSNGVVYGAMCGAAEGYEDDHDREWAPATKDEYEHQNKIEAMAARRAQPIDVSAAVVAPSAPLPPPPAPTRPDDQLEA